MSKKNTAAGSSAAAARKELERLDRELLKVISDRARTCQKLAKARQQEGGLLHDMGEDHAAFQKLLEANKGPLSEAGLRSIWRELQGQARSMIQPLRIAYLGPKYSYSHLAGIARFGDSLDLLSMATIKAVFEAVNVGEANYGIVPIENSTDGRVVDTLDMFARVPLQITGEVQLKIHHQLLGKCTRSQITEVYSKPQALSQCRDWLAKNLPNVRTVEMTSTALAAQIAVDKPGAAAVASYEAGLNYGLNVIDANIEDNKSNVTRFAVIGGDAPKRTGHDKTALMFAIPHKPGALADAMAVFKRGRLNMTWIESFPMPNTKNEYLFFVELEGHQGDSKVKSALLALGRKTDKLNVLGSYARGLPAE
ncbi:P-protein [Anatilimnocola aggregata]|uniref:Bifunctional chorismate mutase/prephenate dehydratase n=1 Tax=Anatilimnocola aggregata TaxID=2528021 RepID=A0A517YH76_9BACT|nr:prephenate dehydratase [Anatilimnocola aggregata]QDU29586.1 P-protein [Anatilimnocola aggregata]